MPGKAYIGSKRDIPNGAALLELYVGYAGSLKPHSDDTDEALPTQAGFCVFIGKEKKYITHAIKQFEGFEEAVGIIDAMIEKAWLTYALKNPRCTGIVQTFLNNNSGYKWGTQEIKSTVSIKEKVRSTNPVEAQKQIRQYHNNHNLKKAK
jgi:hypothetical protein